MAYVYIVVDPHDDIIKLMLAGLPPAFNSNRQTCWPAGFSFSVARLSSKQRADFVPSSLTYRFSFSSNGHSCIP